jgi:hypothetical protein
MNKYEVTIFNRYAPSEKRRVDVEAPSEREAERIALAGGLVNYESGWGVLGSRAVPPNHATSEDMFAMAAICRSRIDNYEKRAAAAIRTAESSGKQLYLSDYPLHRDVSNVIAKYCKEKDIDPMELIPEDIIYSS